MSTKHQRDVGRRLDKLGYTYDGETGTGHARYRHPSGAVVTVSATPGDSRDAQNTIAYARRQLRHTTIGRADAEAFASWVYDHHGDRVEKSMTRISELYVAETNANHGAKTLRDLAVNVGLMRNAGSRRSPIWLVEPPDQPPTTPDELTDATQTPPDATAAPDASDDLATLRRLLERGLGAELQERDERLALAAQQLAELRQRADQLAAELREVERLVTGDAG